MKRIPQQARIIIFFIYIILLLLGSYLIFGDLLPPSNGQSLWLTTCLASIILGDLITSPYFTKPSDTIANSTAAIIVLISINVFNQSVTSITIWLWGISILICVLFLLTSIFVILTKDSAICRVKRISRYFYEIISIDDSHQVIYSFVLLYSLFAFHTDNIYELIFIGIIWVFISFIHPFERIYLVSKKVIGISNASIENVGYEIAGYQIPGIALISSPPNNFVFGQLVAIETKPGQANLGIILDQIELVEKALIRIFLLNNNMNASILNGKQLILINENEISIEEPTKERIKNIRGSLLGIVARDTNIEKLCIEVVNPVHSLQEGMIISSKVNDDVILYQIVNGITKEEIVEKMFTRGFIRVEARKIGKWNGAAFDPARWIPDPNTAVFLVEKTSAKFDNSAIGFLPNTDYPVSIELDNLVTHCAAILGNLGVGKTCLAFELIERMLRSGIKVICLDITDQYTKNFPGATLDGIDTLQLIGSSGERNFQKNQAEGGSILAFKEELKKQLTMFLDPMNVKDVIRIYNPASFVVWKQDSWLKTNNDTAMAVLTPCEITRLFSETVLEILQSYGLSTDAKCCLVLEEAHSLIPEIRSYAHKSDEIATNGTTKMVVQGRKYGLGCMVITQRTANVTKSILNQCNTVFALRSLDSYSVDYVKTFLSNEYAEMIPNLEDRHAIVYGKSSSCKPPVLLKLNNYDEFKTEFRKNYDSDFLSIFIEDESGDFFEECPEDDLTFIDQNGFTSNNSEPPPPEYYDGYMDGLEPPEEILSFEADFTS